MQGSKSRPVPIRRRLTDINPELKIIQEKFKEEKGREREEPEEKPSLLSVKPGKEEVPELLPGRKTGRADINDVIIVPPFKLVNKITANQKAVGTFGDEVKFEDRELSNRTVDEGRELMNKYFEMEGFTGDIIESYNHWIAKLPEQIGSQVIELADKTFIKIAYINISDPGISMSTTRENLTPIKAKLLGMTYSASINVRLGHYRINEEEQAELIYKENGNNGYSNTFTLMEIPVMLGSSICYLHGKKDPQDRANLLECPGDPLGYFIIEGAEKLILMQDNLRSNRTLIYMMNYNGKKIPAIKMQCMTLTDKYTVHLLKGIVDEDPDAIRITFTTNLETAETNNVFIIYHLFSMLKPAGTRNSNVYEVFRNEDKILEMILQFVRPEWQKLVWLTLQPTFLDYRRISNPIEHIALKRGIKIAEKKKGEQFEREQIATGRYSKLEVATEMILESFSTVLFPQMRRRPGDVVLRLQMLSMLIARYAEFNAGLRDLDDRDSVGNKRFETAGFALEKLFNDVWKGVFQSIRAAIKNMGAPGRTSKMTPVNMSYIEGKLRDAKITSQIMDSFKPNAWGAKHYTKKKENMTDILQRTSGLSVFSHLHQVNTPQSKHSQQINIRMVQMSQIGYLDPYDTPEGGKCGTVKHKASTCYVSVDKDDTPTEIKIRSLGIRYKPDEEHQSPCILNGRFLGWVNGKPMLRELIKFRRDDVSKKGFSMVLDGDNVLHVHTDSGRPTRPLLIVDEEEDILVIDKKDEKGMDLRGSTFDVLLRAGAIEYLDAWDQSVLGQEYVLIAQTKNDLVAYRNEKQAAIEMLQTSQGKLDKMIEVEQHITQKPTSEIRRMIYQYVPTSYEETIITERNEEKKIQRSVIRLTDEELVHQFRRELKTARENVMLAQSVVDRLNKDRYTHCEIDPNALLGISASMGPMANRNVGTKVTFQCMPPDVKVYKTETERIPIGDLNNSDTVLTINPKTFEVSNTEIKSYFKINPLEHGKKIYEIETQSGRRIQATGDHPFLTDAGFVQVDQMIKEETKVAIYEK